MKRQFYRVLMVVLAGLFSVAFLSGFGFAEGENQIAEKVVSSDGIEWIPLIEYQSIKLTVSGPGDMVIIKEFISPDTPSIDSELPDGQYAYELSVDPVITHELQAKFALKRAMLERSISMGGTGGGSLPKGSFTQSGYFQIVDGAIPDGDVVETAEAGGGTKTTSDTRTTMDQVILDDLIVDGSLCVGFDCVNGESFGFDTIRLKENNLRIRAVDTSSTASFPSRDWQITFNGTSNGGANKFSIDDIDGGRTPFTIEAGAPSHSLYVDDGGRLGLGTSTPVADIHVKTGNTPTLRLEQDGSSGFTPQTWDVAGNEANFFIRDATNGSKLPFRIKPNAPTNSIYLDTDGVAFGSTNAEEDLHVKRTGASDETIILVEATNGTGAGFEFKEGVGGGDWKAKATLSGDFKIRNHADGVDILYFDKADNHVGIRTSTPAAELDVNGSIALNGGVIHASDIRWKKNIETIDNAIDTVMKLRGVAYEWRNDEFKEKNFSDGKSFGLIGQEVEAIIPEIVTTDSDGYKSIAYTEVTPLLLQAIKEQQATIYELVKELAELKRELQVKKSLADASLTE